MLLRFRKPVKRSHRREIFPVLGATSEAIGKALKGKLLARSPEQT
jgi:hypothetical protein